MTANFTYNGSANASVNAGSYTVIGTVNDPNYQGSSTSTLVIGKASSKIKSRTRMNFLLGKKIIRRKKEPFFETGGKVSAKLAVKYQGTR